MPGQSGAGAVKATHVAALGLQRATDQDVFDAAGDGRSVMITKDCDVAGEWHEAATAPHVARGEGME